MNKSRGHSIAKAIVEKSNYFYNSYWSILFYMSATTIFAALQILLFYTGVLTVNGQAVDAGKHAIAVFWIATSISTASCYVGFIAGILNVKGNHNFIYFTLVQTILQITVIFMAGMIFSIISFSSSFFIMIHRSWVWKNNKLEEWNWTRHGLRKWSLILFIILLTTFLTICILWGPQMYAKQFAPGGQWEGRGNWLFYFDAICSAMFIVAAIMFTFRSRWGFILYFFGKFFIISIYISTGNIVPAVQLVLFATMDITGILAWSFNGKNDEIDIPIELE